MPAEQYESFALPNEDEIPDIGLGFDHKSASFLHHHVVFAELWSLTLGPISDDRGHGFSESMKLCINHHVVFLC